MLETDERGDCLRVLVLCIWSLIMFAFLFTFDLHGLISRGDFYIQMTLSPTFRFFEIYELPPELLLQKIGHTVMFAIWLLSVFLVVQNLKKAVFIISGCAILSEMIQPFFMRDGHLLDMLFDGAGIFLMAVFINIFSQVGK